jgi:hypothetical protein
MRVESAHRAAELGQKKSPFKSTLNQVEGVILKPLEDNIIVIRTENGKEHSYEVCPIIQPRRATLSEGDTAMLLVDKEKKVTDDAFVPERTK